MASIIRVSSLESPDAEPIQVDDVIEVNSEARLKGGVTDESSNPWGIESVVGEDSTYVKFPDGTLICYGKTGVIASGGIELVTFPYAFIDRPSIAVTSLTRTDYAVAAGTGGSDTYLTATSVSICALSGATNVASWIAIGRWK